MKSARKLICHGCVSSLSARGPDIEKGRWLPTRVKKPILLDNCFIQIVNVTFWSVFRLMMFPKIDQSSAETWLDQPG